MAISPGLLNTLCTALIRAADLAPIDPGIGVLLLSSKRVKQDYLLGGPIGSPNSNIFWGMHLKGERTAVPMGLVLVTLLLLAPFLSLVLEGQEPTLDFDFNLLILCVYDLGVKAHSFREK